MSRAARRRPSSGRLFLMEAQLPPGKYLVLGGEGPAGASGPVATPTAVRATPRTDTSTTVQNHLGGDGMSSTSADSRARSRRRGGATIENRWRTSLARRTTV